MTFLMRLGYNVIMSLKNVLSLKLEQSCYIYQLLRRPKLILIAINKKLYN